MDTLGRIMPVVTTTGDSLGVWIVQFADQNWSGFDNLADAEAYRDAYHEALIRQFHERIEKLEETEESASEDCQGVHSLVSDDGIRWVCGMCGYEESMAEYEGGWEW